MLFLGQNISFDEWLLIHFNNYPGKLMSLNKDGT